MVRRFAVDATKIVHETIDDESIIINTVTGVYYTAKGCASRLWIALAQGISAEELLPLVKLEHAKAVLLEFIQILLAEELLVLRKEGSPGINPPTFDFSPCQEQEIPVIQKFNDLQELIELDPIHEIDVEQGWPFTERPS